MFVVVVVVAVGAGVVYHRKTGLLFAVLWGLITQFGVVCNHFQSWSFHRCKLKCIIRKSRLFDPILQQVLIASSISIFLQY